MTQYVFNRPEDIINTFRELHTNQNLSLDTVALRTGFTLGQVITICQQNKIYRDNAKYGSPANQIKTYSKLNSKREIIKNHYIRDKWSIKALCKLVDVSYVTMQNFLRENGIKRPPPKKQGLTKKEAKEKSQFKSKRVFDGQSELLPEAGQCKFVINEKPPFKFCQNKALDGKSYCSEHCQTV